MKNLKMFFILFMLLTIALFSVACGGGNSSGDGATETTFLNISTSTTGGTFYAVGGKLADLINKYVENTQATAEATAGGVENARLIKNKETSLALMPGDTLYNAVNGVGEFKNEDKIEINEIAALYETPLQVVALKRSGINSIQDLKGKKVSIGAPGSSTAVRAEIVLNAHGLTLDDIKVDSTTSGEASNQMLDGLIDAAFFASGAPMAAIMDVAAKEEINMLSIEPAAMDKIEQEHPDLFEYIIKGGVYPNVDTDTVCVANMAVLCCRPDLSEDLVYQITKTIHEQRDEFITAHKSLEKSFNMKTAVTQTKLAPMHPGALKYYQEAGVMK
ncbi:MAG: TAXI family TRAP transporter solute-binding subunit [Dehalobacterium sp.]